MNLRLPSVATAVIVSCLASACASSIPLDTNQEITDKLLQDTMDIQVMAYTYEFPEVYRGEHEIKNVAIVSSQFGKFFGRGEARGLGMAEGALKGLAVGLGGRKMTVHVHERAAKLLKLEYDEKKDVARGSLTAKLSVRKKDKEMTATRNIKVFSNAKSLIALEEDAGGRGWVVGSRAISTMHLDDEEVAAVARELEVDALIAICVNEEKIQVQFVVPFAKFKIANGDKPYPLDVNHARMLTLRYSGITGSIRDGERVGELMARCIRLWYPAS